MAVEIYTQPWCPYCARAIDLLRKKGVAFQEIDAPQGSAERGRGGPALRTLQRAADFHRRGAYRRMRRPHGVGAFA